MSKDSLNNFQRQETAKWLLNISQAVMVGGPGSYFIPGVSERVGVRGVIGSIILALALYSFAMAYARKVNNDH